MKGINTVSNLSSILFELIVILLLLLNIIVESKFAKHAIFDISPKIENTEYLLGYAKWSSWSRCSKTCGSGIQYQLRRCLDVHCSGPSSRYRVCNTQKCEKETLSDAEIECSLKNKHYQNKTIFHDKWYPVTDENKPCTLICKSDKEGITRDFSTNLRDGNKCLKPSGNEGVCFKGKCENLGCDMIIGSNTRVDQCGVCGGNGKSCKKNIFQWKDTQQFSPCDKTCGSNRYRVSVSVCMNTVTNRVVPERLCGDQIRPRPKIKTCPHIVCPVQSKIKFLYNWLESEWSSCTVTCGGGIQTRIVVCVETISDTNSVKKDSLPDSFSLSDTVENRKVDDHYCWNNSKPITEQKCNEEICPTWVTGEWGICSTTCDIGEQKREVLCQHGNQTVDDILCRIIEKPNDVQQCYNSQKCDNLKKLSGGKANNVIRNVDRYRFVAENPFLKWNDASKNGGYSLQEEPARLLHGFTANTVDKTKPRFYPGVWSECSSTCGPGIRTRIVECVAFQSITSSIIKLPDYECEGDTKPNLFQPCQTQVCPYEADNNKITSETVDESESNSVKDDSVLHNGIYKWDYGEWSECSASCLGGKTKSTLKCIDTVNKITVSWSYCNPKRRPVDLWRDCNKIPCPPAWDVGEWSDCSHTCGGGIKTRKVRCTRQMSETGGAESTLILPDAQCPGSKPIHQEPCGMSDCHMTWRVDQWSQCSTTCGSGEQKRQIYCEKRLSNGEIKTFDSYECHHLEKPPTLQLCNLGSCDDTSSSGFTYNVDLPYESLPLRQYADDSTNSIDKNFDQINHHHKKLTLNIGGIANLYEGTSIKIKCPVKNFDKSKIIWTRDGQRIKNNAHIRVSSNGALRIFHARMEDAGVYACHAHGIQGNVTLNFKHHETDNHPTFDDSDINRTKFKHYLDNTKYDITNNDNDNDDDDDENVDEIEKINSDILSPNDVDLQLIKKIKSSLLRLNEYRFLTKIHNVTEPGKLKVDYQTGAWSPCSQQECGKSDGAQVRLIKCRIIYDHSTAYVDDDICDAYSIQRPPSTKSCFNLNCPEWKTSEWTECITSRCIKKHTSIQRRKVQCVYNNGTNAEFSLCNRRTRPKIKTECVNPNCTSEWKPSIWGKCSKNCGDGGVQMRLLRCVWKGTRKAAGNNCDQSIRPPAIRTCPEIQRPCIPGENLNKEKLVKDYPNQSNSSANSVVSDSESIPLSSSLSNTRLSDQPFRNLQKWRGWRLYNWDWNRLDDKLRRF